MKSNVSTFQLVVLAIFIFIGIAGVVVFAGFGGTNKEHVPKAVIWGTVPAQYINEMVRIINAQDTVVDVKYEQFSKDTFRDRFINALAEGAGPDIVLLSDDVLYAEASKLGVIPYTVFTQRDYADTYVNAAENFMVKDGVLGVPFSIDPIVMYWNKNIFTTEGLTAPPKKWSELEKMTPVLSKINDTKGILRSGVALGEMRNINNAKEILVTMLMQAGNTVTGIDSQTGAIVSTLDRAGTDVKFPADSVIKYFTAYANPLNQVYSWSRSMPDSRKAFLSGDLAIYFGYTSEYAELRRENPNLDFDVASMPQNSDQYNVTYGKLTAFSVTRKAQSSMDAYRVIAMLTSQSSQKLWVELTGLPPVRKDLLGSTPNDKYLSVFYRSAIQSKTWFDPDPTYSALIFRDMIEAITTGKTPSTDAISTAKQRLDLLLRGVKS